MIKNNFKIALLAILSVTLIVPLAINAQADENATITITRHIEEDEFKDTVEQIHMMNAEQTRLREQVGVDNSARFSELDSAIQQLMPILDKHQEQTFAKYYIEPVRKQYLETVETDLRASVYDALADRVDYFSVNLNTKDKIVEVVLSDPNKVETIEKLLDNQPTDVQYNITVAEYSDLACANQTDDCNPIVGGIEIEGDCTLGLPVRTGSWPFYSYHFVTAGHCINDNADMNQPNESSGEIGDSTDSRYESTCDCAISDKTTGTTSNSKVWRSSNNYLTITSESTSRPADGTDITVFGVSSGFVQSEVTDPNHTFYHNGVNWDLVQIEYALSGGDSGAPVANAAGNKILGIVKGGDGYDSDFSPWDQVESKFGGLTLH